MQFQSLAQASLISLQLLFPDQTEKVLSFRQIEAGILRIHYPEESEPAGYLGSKEARRWALGIAEELEKGLSVLKEAASSEPTLKCSPKLHALDRARLDVFLVPTLQFSRTDTEDSEYGERRGYDHPQNPGPIIDLSVWNEKKVEFLIVHEAVHRWCDSGELTLLSRWMEEGMADFIAGEATGQVPQLGVTRYFASPATPWLYGSSYLWFAARKEVRTKEEFLKALASYHLGMRADRIFGAQSDVAERVKQRNADAATPYGFKSKTCMKSQHCVPYRLQPWGEVDLEPGAAPAKSYWIWNGPLPGESGR